MMNARMNECMNEWTNEWMNEWNTNVQITVLVCEWLYLMEFNSRFGIQWTDWERTILLNKHLDRLREQKVEGVNPARNESY